MICIPISNSSFTRIYFDIISIDFCQFSFVPFSGDSLTVTDASARYLCTRKKIASVKNKREMLSGRLVPKCQFPACFHDPFVRQGSAG